MTRCEYYKICSRGALGGHSGRCILHSDAEKDTEAFDRALKMHVEEYGTDFRGIVFPGTHLPIISPRYEKRAKFTEATFKNHVFMKGASFTQGADFSEATFHGQAFFSRATFRAQSSFRGAVFRQGADFQDATFNSKADFSQAYFLEAGPEIEGADFKDANFEEGVFFCRSIFHDTAHLTSAFNGRVDLEEAIFMDYVQFEDSF